MSYRFAGPDGHGWTWIYTEASNIRPRGINRPIPTTSQIGVNGTFFEESSPTLEPLGMYWFPNHGGRYSPTAPVNNSKTLYGVKDNSGNVIPKWGWYTDISQIFNDEGRDNVMWIISGKSFREEDYTWAQRLSRPRTVMGFSDFGQIWLGTNASGKTVSETLSDLDNRYGNIQARNFIMLDGGGSTCMRVVNNGEVQYYPYSDRSISNMISLINT